MSKQPRLLQQLSFHKQTQLLQYLAGQIESKEGISKQCYIVQHGHRVSSTAFVCSTLQAVNLQKALISYLLHT